MLKQLLKITDTKVLCKNINASLNIFLCILVVMLAAEALMAFYGKPSSLALLAYAGLIVVGSLSKRYVKTVAEK